LMGVLVISFAATTLDTATRIQRFIVAEIGAAVGAGFLTNRVVATAIAVVPGILLAIVEVPDPARPDATQAAGLFLWPIFGASNQMLAALTLLVLSLYFWRRRRPVMPLVIPMILVTVVALVSLVVKLSEFLNAENWFLVGVTGVLLALVLWMLAEAAILLRRGAPSAG
ncbi:MAG: carbon starvation protein A, partial [Planctomycetes bacterium]|nr:carbon starvation protein A [Planctomycetota bacterium]